MSKNAAFNKLDEHLAELRHLDIDTPDRDTRIIADLMNAVGRFALEERESLTVEGWTPRGPIMKEIVLRLTSPQNRKALRSWYASLKGPLNPRARALRNFLSKQIGEPLDELAIQPVQEPDAHPGRRAR